MTFKDHADVVQTGDETGAIHLAAAARAVAEPDNVGSVLAEAQFKGQLLGVIGEGHKPRLPVAVISHQDGQFAAGDEGTGTVLDQQPIPLQEGVQRRGPREVSGIRRIEFLPPVGGMNPDKFKAFAWILRTIASVGPLMQVARPAVDPQFSTNIAASSTAGHRIEDTPNVEEAEQILDEVPPAIAGVGTVAVLSRSGVVVQARQAGDRTGIPGSLREFGVDRLVLLLLRRNRRNPTQSSGVEGIDVA